MGGARRAAACRAAGTHGPGLRCCVVGGWVAVGQRLRGRDRPAVGREQRRVSAHPAERSPLRARGHCWSDRRDRSAARGTGRIGSCRSPGASRAPACFSRWRCRHSPTLVSESEPLPAPISALVAEHALSQRHGTTVLVQEHYATSRRAAARTTVLAEQFLARFPRQRAFLEGLVAQHKPNAADQLRPILELADVYDAPSLE